MQHITPQQAIQLARENHTLKQQNTKLRKGLFVVLVACYALGVTIFLLLSKGY